MASRRAQDPASTPAEPAASRVVVEDLGETVRLKIDEQVPWDVALKILDALKRHSE